MAENTTALNSKYIIDGVEMEYTPLQLLQDCMAPEIAADFGHFGAEGVVVDESVDPEIEASRLDESRTDEYIAEVIASSSLHRIAPRTGVKGYAQSVIADALISCLWCEDGTTLNDISVALCWRWNFGPMGNAAAFYECVGEASRYLFDIDVAVVDATLEQAQQNSLEVNVLFRGKPLNLSAQADSSSWLIYVPFDTCSFRLGGSLLSQVAGASGDPASELIDPAYFVDCYEVVKELVDDGVAVCGESVGRGGMIAAMRRLCSRISEVSGAPCGAEMNLGGIMQAYAEENALRVLFGEVPGVILQIPDDDYDYVDSQFLLQDLAYYPLGHPRLGTGNIVVQKTQKTNVLSILESLTKN